MLVRLRSKLFSILMVCLRPSRQRCLKRIQNHSRRLRCRPHLRACQQNSLSDPSRHCLPANTPLDLRHDPYRSLRPLSMSQDATSPTVLWVRSNSPNSPRFSHRQSPHLSFNRSGDLVFSRQPCPNLCSRLAVLPGVGAIDQPALHRRWL
jgi:hypothetical protein